MIKDAASSGFPCGLANLWKSEQRILLGDNGSTNARCYLAQSQFRNRFEAKRRFREELSKNRNLPHYP